MPEIIFALASAGFASSSVGAFFGWLKSRRNGHDRRSTVTISDSSGRELTIASGTEDSSQIEEYLLRAIRVKASNSQPGRPSGSTSGKHEA
jgi:hypothetical protein